MMNERIEKFMRDQLSVWPLACENYRNLKKVRTKQLTVGGLAVTVQHNPCRVVSSEAAMDAKSLSERPCFLCPEHRQKEQSHLEFEGRKGRMYRITLNPFPIFPSHLVVSSFDHTPQSIWHRVPDMLEFISANPDMVCFYNGPKGGASAPVHHHFQACPAGMMPLLDRMDSLLDSNDTTILRHLANVKEAEAFHYQEFARGVFLLRAATPKSLVKLFYRLLDCSPTVEGDDEPRLNLLTWKAGAEFRAAVVFRREHRSHHYFSTQSDHLAMSIGCADVAGVFITPREEDFKKLDSKLLGEVVEEVCITAEDESLILRRLSRSQPSVEVGILSAPRIEFEIISDGAGLQSVSLSEGKILYGGALYDELRFDARTLSTMFAEPSFILHNVTIGVDFHWERKVSQRFAGTLKFIVDGDKLTAVNIIGVEDYLLSVISSEMRASAGLEFLKAHAVISRSWLMSNIAHRTGRDGFSRTDGNLLAGGTQASSAEGAPGDDRCGERHSASRLPGASCLESEAAWGTSDELIKWYDHEDHDLFDVCADDHCQRYQGLTMAVGRTVREAIDQTWGLVLTHGGEVCDARYSKCCGGTTELFSSCWEDKDLPYLQSFPDTAPEGGDPFCDTSDASVLSQVLNDYDLETKDFYRWETEYDRPVLSSLVARRSGLDFGDILALVPVERGPSGRLTKLKVIGTKRTLTIGKELTIRKFLSESHLKSSAFTISYFDGSDEVPESDVLERSSKGIPAWDRLVLHGSGWGHGVGLCQIGAAVMASQGHTFDQILAHYYPFASITEAGAQTPPSSTACAGEGRAAGNLGKHIH